MIGTHRYAVFPALPKYPDWFSQYLIITTAIWLIIWLYAVVRRN